MVLPYMGSDVWILVERGSVMEKAAGGLNE